MAGRFNFGAFEFQRYNLVLDKRVKGLPEILNYFQSSN